MVGEGIALDSNIAIEIIRGNKEVIDKVGNYAKAYLPVTVCGELLFGAANSANSKRNLPLYQDFIDQFIILPTQEETATIYANARLKLKKKGKPIPENDIWIASICLENNLPLFTFDKHFQNLDQLEIIR